MNTEIEIRSFGGPEKLIPIEKPPVPLTSGKVRVRVAAAGVNFADLMMRMGLYPEAPKPPFTPGYEIAGTILETGPGVSGIGVGDRVLAGTRFGGYATEVVLDAIQVRRIPQRISEVEAASIPVNFITAWVALHDLARVRKGDRVLIPNAAGGVGVAAIQIASQAGAVVTGVVGSEAKLAIVRELGGAGARAMTYAGWEARPNSERERSFDIILDASGGGSVKRNLKLLASGGRIVCFGAAELVGGKKRSLIHTLRALARTPLLTPFGLMMSNTGVFGLNLLKVMDESPEVAANALDQVLAQFEKGAFKTVVGKTFPLDRAGEAHTFLLSRANVGKVVLTNS